MLNTTNVSWGRIVGTATGSVLAGPVGALVGNLAGGLLQTFLPGAAGVSTLLGAIVGKTLEKGSEAVIKQWSPAEKQQINHDLQTAFRDALIEAINDIGGGSCFRSAWQVGRDVPPQAVFPLATLERQDAALAEQACQLLQKMVSAVLAQQVLPLEPPVDQPAASVVAYLQAETPEELDRAFFAQVITPFLQQGEGPLVLEEMRRLGFDLEGHLRQKLLDRTLVHLGEFLKLRAPAWRAFNRLLLENLRTQIRELDASRQFGLSAAELSQVEIEVVRLQELLQTSSLANELAEWMSAVGRIEKRLDEGFDSLFHRIEQDHRDTLERLQGLLGVTGRLEAKMDRMLLVLENGGWEVIGTPSAPLDEPPEPGESPFMGLQFFTEADAHLFFGREMLTARLVGRLRQHDFLAVVGTSGSGKSSVVRAGLVPALRSGETLADGTLPPPGSADWLFHVITPTAHPLDALAATLTRDALSITETTTLADDLAQEPRTLRLHARKLLSRHDHQARPHSRLLLVVDQFEEVFTLCRNEQERSSFIDNLMAAVEPDMESPILPNEGPVLVVIVLRADFYAHCGQYEALRNALVHHQEFIGPMSQEELRRAIEEPAKRGGWKFERGVVELLLRDVGNEPGALPLLSHALLETWKRRRGRTMVLESYAESGMVRGAIAQTAESVFNQQLTPEQRPLARNIFLRLTELGESTQDTRRRVTLDELLSTGRQEEDVQNILRKLVDARLVTTGEGTVELAHEALIREWPTLRQWLVENREWLRIHRHLTEAAQEWLALQRDPGELYRGSRLAQVQEWFEPYWGELNSLEREFLAASQRLAQQEEAEKVAQQQRELEQARTLAEMERRRAEEQQSAAQQLRRRAVLLAGLLGIALLLAGVSVLFGRAANRNATLAEQNAATAQAASTQAVRQQAIAASERDRAAYQAQVALSRQLAAQATSLSGDLDLGLLLSLQAGRTLPGSFEYRQSLLTLLQSAPPLVTFLHGHSGIVFDVAISPDGSLAASGGQDQTIILWDLKSYEPVATLAGHAGWVNTVSFSPDGTLLAAGSDAVQLWNPQTYAPIGEPFAASPQQIWGLAFHPTRPLLAVAGEGNTIVLWDLTDAEAPVMLGEPLALHTEDVRSLAFSPDGSLLASGSWDYTLALWNVADPARPALIGEPLQGHTDWVRSIAFHPSGQILASGGADNQVILWDLRDPARPEPLAPPLSGHSNQVYSVAFSQGDGNLLATGGGDKRIQLWDVSDPAAPQQAGPALMGQAAVIQTLAFSPDGRLLSGSDDNSVAVWNPTTKQRLARILPGHTAPVRDVDFSPNGARLASISNDGTIRLWDTRNRNELRPLGAPIPLATDEEPRTLAFSPNGQLLASAGSTGTITLWDMSEPLHPLMLGDPFPAHTDWISTLAFHPTDPILASASGDTTIRLWDLSNPTAVQPIGEPLAGHTDWAVSLAFSRNGSILASGGGDNNIILWDMATHKPITTLAGHSWRVWALDFSPVSNLLASGGQDSFLVLWNIDKALAAVTPGEQPGRLPMEPSFAQGFTNHANTVGTVAFSHNGTMLASAGVEQMVLLWDVVERQPLGPPLQAHTAPVVSTAFSPTGEWLATAGYDNAVILWDVSLASWQTLACRIANRNLTQAEWTRYVGAAPYQPTCPE